MLGLSKDWNAPFELEGRFRFDMTAPKGQAYLSVSADRIMQQVMVFDWGIGLDCGDFTVNSGADHNLGPQVKVRWYPDPAMEQVCEP
jgi:hypothetical protein